MPTTSKVGLPVAIYTRYSTDRQDARSIDDQRRRCLAYGAAHDFRVVAEFKDAAVSGAYIERAGMQRLLEAARTRGGAPFGAVLVDDLSRLSRDLGNTWQIVFHDLASVGIKVIDITSGISSDGAGARLTFGAMALVNDQFLQLVRAETHRGLEGRALAGFSTGGRCFGYSTVLEENPPHPEHPRKPPVVDPVQAAVVVRVFRLFAQGTGLKEIAAILNEEGLAAPNDGGRGNKRGKGWGHTTIRAMLRNERYRGRSIWNRSKWVRIAGHKSRRRVARPESEWVVSDWPEIIAADLWAEVQGRFGRVHSKARGRPPGTGRHKSLMSGLMRCGVCGGSMTVVSRKSKAGVPYARFGCTAHSSRGDAICSNALTVSEMRASRTLVSALKDRLDRPETIDRFVTTFNRHSSALRRQTVTGADDPNRAVRDCERRIANLTESLAKLGWSDALSAKLREEEAQLRRLKSERTSDLKRRIAPIVPHPTAIMEYLKNLFALLDTDPARGQEILSRFVSPITMTPEADGPNRGYRATGAFNLAYFLGVPSKGPGKSSCAGRI